MYENNCIYLVELITDRYSGGMSRMTVGYMLSEEEAKSYCDAKTKEIEGSFNENMGCKYYQFRKLELLKNNL